MRLRRFILLAVLVGTAGCAKNTEKLNFFEVSDNVFPEEWKEERDYHFPSSAYFRSVTVQEKEYAVLDCSFLKENTLTTVVENLTEVYPELTYEDKFFLKRENGEENWEAALLSEVSESMYYNPFITFTSTENGMIVLGGELSQIYITNDGGTTWFPAGSIPELGQSIHGGVYCVFGSEENHFLIGYRYKAGEKEGNVYLTEDNADTWIQVELPIPKSKDMEYRYSEPLRFWQEEGTIFLEMLARANDPKRREEGEYYDCVAYYVVQSKDGGATWELKSSEELDYQLRTD